MGFRLLGEVAMLLHFAFLVYVATGGFLAWRWPKAFWPHLACAAYALGVTAVGWLCPLTYVENWARTRAGEPEIPGTGFIDAYLTGVVYPEDHLVTFQFTVAASVAVSWAGLALLLWRARTRPRSPEPDPHH